MKLLLVIILTIVSSLTAWLYVEFEFHVSYLIILVSFYVTVYYGLNRVIDKPRNDAAPTKDSPRRRN
ncbi:hypothetical protein E4656_01985 [Natronospirillum operosum]|uniref:Uncharacterized protein n=1 Tax=Natronospirillum operosum TaxID=2759953 RepID=A0A4Z0WBN1_9GAMM|nr:hypothetical protein [Natronospirillum operosum]TGG95214.1 hypothetical protein E4656_01985 [Natronospirillum operosum]